MNTAKLLEGSLEILILGALRTGSHDAYGIIEELQRCAGEPLMIEIAMLHPVLYRLEGKGLIEGDWRHGTTGTRQMHYHLTEKGNARLHEDEVGWREFVDLVDRMLRHGVPSWT